MRTALRNTDELQNVTSITFRRLESARATMRYCGPGANGEDGNDAYPEIFLAFSGNMLQITI